MQIGRIQEPIFLFIGDIFFWTIALWGTLFVRYVELPTYNLFVTHLAPFSIIFLIWVFVFFIFDLYKKQTLLVQGRLPRTILHAQIVNSIIALIFFYFIPYFGITPKTVLFIYLVLSFALVSVWRIYIADLVYKGKKVNALIVGEESVEEELVKELRDNAQYRANIFHISQFNIDKVINLIAEHDIQTIIFDVRKEQIDKHPDLYKLLFLHVQFIDTRTLYEEVFERIPLQLLYDNWFIESISNHPKKVYDISRRAIDILIGFVLGVLSLVLYPFVYAAIKLEDGGPIFISQRRIGKDNTHVRLYKFRTMSFNDEGRYETGKVNKVTKVGKFLRKSRIDELPQLWNVLKGDISLIGPRPELPELVKEYDKQIPYYSTRYLIQPGLSGWAQIYHEKHPHHGTDVEETKNKLSYDLFYIKNRNLILDIKIILKTIRTLLSRTGI